MKKTKRIIAIGCAILVILSISCVTAFAGKKPIIGTTRIANQVESNGDPLVFDDTMLFVYDFPYQNQSNPIIQGKTMNIYTKDGVYLGETSPLQPTRYTRSYNGTQYRIYSFQFNNQTYYLETAMLDVQTEDTLLTWANK